MAPVSARVVEIPVSSIDVGEQQIRETPDDESIGELAESIASKGLLQPIGVSSAPDGRYQLRWGHRRLLAHQRLRKATIRATVYDGKEESIKGIALVENLHRTQMAFADEVEAVSHLHYEEGKSVEQIATIVSKGRNWVLNRLMVPTLPDFMREPLLAGDLPISHAEVIAKVPNEGAQRYLVSQAVVQKWSKSALQQIAACYMGPIPEEQPAADGIKGVNPNPQNSPFQYTCEMCGEKGELHEFTLVRVHKENAGCRSNSNRPDTESGRVHGMDSDRDEHSRADDRGQDREEQTAEVKRDEPD